MSGLARPVLRGLLWGLLAAVVVVVALVTVESRRGREAEPPVLSELPEFSLVNRDGRPVTSGDLAGAAWVADFVFTRCAGPCPLMTRRMAALGERLPEGVRRLSITVDPDHDTPELLAEYAAQNGAPDSWLFLTGGKQEIWDLSVAGFKLGVADAASLEAGEGAGEDADSTPPEGPDAEPSPGAPPAHPGPILHSTRFVLIDPQGRIRGYYDAFEEEDLDRLVRDARAVAGG